MLSPELEARIDGALDALAAAKFALVGEKLIPTGLGARADLENRAIVNFYSTDTIQVQRDPTREVRWALREYVKHPFPVTTDDVYIVSGNRDEPLDTVRRWFAAASLKPVRIHLCCEADLARLWGNTNQGFAVAIVPTGEGDDKPTVSEQLALLLQLYGPERLAIIHQRQTEPPQIDGAQYVPFDEEFDVISAALMFNRMAKCGYNIEEITQPASAENGSTDEVF